MSRRVRVAVTCGADPADPASYSGYPSGLLRALGALDLDAVPVRGAPPAAALAWLERAILVTLLRPSDLRDLGAARRRLRPGTVMSPVMPVVRAHAARRGLRRAGPLDGVVQYGTEFDLPAGVPYVTVEDATFRQAAESYPWPWLGRAGPARIARDVRKAQRRYERARACAFTNHWAAGSAVRDHGLPPEKVHVIGVGRNHEPPAAERDWSTPRALFVGVDWERKNGPAVLRAFAALRRERPDARLDVVGGHPRLDEPGVTGHGRLSLRDPAGRARIEALYSAATFFVLPSLHEPSAIVYAEAQAAGLASIGTSHGGSATIIGDAGRVVDPRSEGELVRAMLELADPEVARRLGALALARAPLFTWRAVAERILRILAPPGVDVQALTAPLP